MSVDLRMADGHRAQLGFDVRIRAANLQPNAPILVLIHYCGGNAAGVFGEANGGGIISAGRQVRLLIVLPQTSRNCWDIATTPTLTHNGGGDSLAIVHQVKYAITKHARMPIAST